MKYLEETNYRDRKQNSDYQVLQRAGNGELLLIGLEFQHFLF